MGRAPATFITNQVMDGISTYGGGSCDIIGILAQNSEYGMFPCLTSNHLSPHTTCKHHHTQGPTRPHHRTAVTITGPDHRPVGLRSTYHWRVSSPKSEGREDELRPSPHCVGGYRRCTWVGPSLQSPAIINTPCGGCIADWCMTWRLSRSTPTYGLDGSEDLLAQVPSSDTSVITSTPWMYQVGRRKRAGCREYHPQRPSPMPNRPPQ